MILCLVMECDDDVNVVKWVCDNFVDVKCGDCVYLFYILLW